MTTDLDKALATIEEIVTAARGPQQLDEAAPIYDKVHRRSIRLQPMNPDEYDPSFLPGRELVLGFEEGPDGTIAMNFDALRELRDRLTIAIDNITDEIRAEKSADV